VYDVASSKPLTAVNHALPGVFYYDLVSGEFLYKRIGKTSRVDKLDEIQHLLARSLEAERSGLPAPSPHLTKSHWVSANALLPAYGTGAVLYACLPTDSFRSPKHTSSLCRDCRGNLNQSLSLAYSVHVSKLLPSNARIPMQDRVVWSYDLPAIRKTAQLVSQGVPDAHVWIIATPWTAEFYRGKPQGPLPSGLGLIAMSMEPVGEVLLSKHLPSVDLKDAVWRTLCVFHKGQYWEDGYLARG
jgi:hypothetical protein